MKKKAPEGQPDDEPAVEREAEKAATAPRRGRSPRPAAPASKIPTPQGNALVAQILEFIRTMTGSPYLTQRLVGAFAGLVLLVMPCLIFAGVLAGAAVMIWIHPDPRVKVAAAIVLSTIAGGIAIGKARKKN